MESRPFEVAVQGSHSIPIPMEIATPFLEKGHRRVKVKATFEGKFIEFFAALQKRKELVFIMFSKNHQKTLGIFPNDYFRLQFFEDNSKYGADMPEELEAVLSSDYEAYQIFESLTAGKKRGIIYMIIRYKNPQTRIDKSLLLCENLKRGIRDNKVLL
ncbi:MAG: YdeI/OmpD-associated family protein, partial [Bacteroidota bacterium]